MHNLVIIFFEKALSAPLFFQTPIIKKNYHRFASIGEEYNFRVSCSIPKYIRGSTVRKGMTLAKKAAVISDYTPTHIFDKLKYGKDRQKILARLAAHFPVINDPRMSLICDNKLLTAQTFPQYSPQTENVTKKNFHATLKRIRGNKVVFKPWYGCGSSGVVIKDKKHACPSDIGDRYIAQQYISTKDGIKGIPQQNTLRCIIINGNCFFLTLETARTGELVSGNVKTVHITPADLPMKKIQSMLDDIDSVFKQFTPRIYSVDLFVTKKEGIYLAEINSKPGLYPLKDESQDDYDRIMRAFFHELEAS